MTKSSSRSSFATVAGCAIWLLLPFVAGAIGGWATTSSVNDWYVDLNKPTWNPPGWIFGPVWTALYLAMGAAACLVWTSAPWNRTRMALLGFAGHLVLNSLWSILFFGMQQPGWAFACILLLWLAIGLVAWFFDRHSRLATFLMLPYWLWVSFASCLNFSIWMLNR